MSPTPDTPQERDDKADALQTERIDKAEVLAREVRRFRWEVRFYYFALFLFIIGERTDLI